MSIRERRKDLESYVQEILINNNNPRTTQQQQVWTRVRLILVLRKDKTVFQIVNTI